jgi:hypothetical protein
MDNNNSGKKLIAIVVVVILVAVFLAIWFSVRETGSTGNNAVIPVTLSFNDAQQANKTASIDVPDQFPGTVVYVARVDFPAGGFIVVRKNNNGQVGEAIGATFFDKDTRIGNVDLTESTVDGQTYFAQAWTDDGDARFSTSTDIIITKADGSVLQVQFKATKDLPEKKG